jgi:hypothetical protein
VELGSGWKRPAAMAEKSKRQSAKSQTRCRQAAVAGCLSDKSTARFAQRKPIWVSSSGFFQPFLSSRFKR